jgi:DNA polymerase II large subunit
MSHVARSFELMDESLVRAARDQTARTEVADALREHARKIVNYSVQTGYSFEMAEADIALVVSISAYQFEGTQESVSELQDRLRAFHNAAMTAAQARVPHESSAEGWHLADRQRAVA